MNYTAIITRSLSFLLAISLMAPVCANPAHRRGIEMRERMREQWTKEHASNQPAPATTNQASPEATEQEQASKKSFISRALSKIMQWISKPAVIIGSSVVGIVLLFLAHRMKNHNDTVTATHNNPDNAAPVAPHVDPNLQFAPHDATAPVTQDTQPNTPINTIDELPADPALAANDNPAPIAPIQNPDQTPPADNGTAVKTEPVTAIATDAQPEVPQPTEPKIIPALDTTQNPVAQQPQLPELPTRQTPATTTANPVIIPTIVITPTPNNRPVTPPPAEQPRPTVVVDDLPEVPQSRGLAAGSPVADRVETHATTIDRSVTPPPVEQPKHEKLTQEPAAETIAATPALPQTNTALDQTVVSAVIAPTIEVKVTALPSQQTPIAEPIPTTQPAAPTITEQPATATQPRSASPAHTQQAESSDVESVVSDDVDDFKEVPLTDAHLPATTQTSYGTQAIQPVSASGSENDNDADEFEDVPGPKTPLFLFNHLETPKRNTPQIVAATMNATNQVQGPNQPAPGFFARIKNTIKNVLSTNIPVIHAHDEFWI